MKPWTIVSAFAFALLWTVWSTTGQTQTPSPSPSPTATGQVSNYTFRFNTGISGVFLNEMTFKSEQPLNLGACTVTEKINGPLICANNCQNQSVCLLELSGPAGSSVNDVLQLVSETPVSSSPSPTVTSSPSTLNFSAARFGTMILSPQDGRSREQKRIDAINQVTGP